MITIEQYKSCTKLIQA